MVLTLVSHSLSVADLVPTVCSHALCFPYNLAVISEDLINFLLIFFK